MLDMPFDAVSYAMGAKSGGGGSSGGGGLVVTFNGTSLDKTYAEIAGAISNGSGAIVLYVDSDVNLIGYINACFTFDGAYCVAFAGVDMAGEVSTYIFTATSEDGTLNKMGE